MASYKLYCDEEDVLHLDGVVNLSSIVEVRDKGIELMALLSTIRFDLSKLEQVNSTGLALLISWTRYAKNNQKQISFQNLPKPLLALGRVSCIDTILPINIF